MNTSALSLYPILGCPGNKRTAIDETELLLSQVLNEDELEAMAC